MAMNQGQFLQAPPVQQQVPGQVPGLQFQQPRKYFGVEKKGDMKKSSIFLSNPRGEQPQTHVDTHQGSMRLEFKKKNIVQGVQPSQNPQAQVTNKPGLMQIPGLASGGTKPTMWSSQIIKPSSEIGKYAGGAAEFDLRFGPKKTGLESLGRTVAKQENKSPFLTSQVPTNIAPEKRSLEINTTENTFSYPLQGETKAYDKPNFQPATDTNYGMTKKINYTPNFAPSYSASIGSSSSYGSASDSYSGIGGTGSTSTYSSLTSGAGSSSYGSYPKPSVSDYSKPLPDYKPNFQYKSPTTDYKPISDYKPTDYSTPSTTTDYSKPSPYYGSSALSSSSYPPTTYNNEPPVKDKNYYLEQAMKSYDFTKNQLADTGSGSSYGNYGGGNYGGGGGFSKNKTQQAPSSSASSGLPKGKEPQLASNLSKSDFDIGKKLGKGQFGQVFLVKHKKTGFICALKILKKSHIREQKVEGALLRQLKIQFYLHHQNIVALYGFFHDYEAVYLLLEVCCGGQLFDMLKKQRRLPQPLTADIVRQVCLGIDRIHREKIIHRDIKPQNIIMHEGVAKICDFGWSVYRGDGLRTTFCGTPMYTAPAMLKGEEYGESVDIWAIGVLTYQLLIGRIPFKIMTEDDLDRILTDEIKFPDYVDVTSTAKDFILKVLNRNKGPKLDIQDLLNHKFLQIPKKTNEFDSLML